MKKYIEAGFGIVIGMALADFVIKVVNAAANKVANNIIENEEESEVETTEENE